MNRINKLEIISLIGVVLSYVLLIKLGISTLFYIPLMFLVAIYFFPIKLLREIKSEKIVLKGFAYYIISMTVALSYVSYLLGNNYSLKLVYLVLTVLNLFLIYKFNAIKFKPELYFMMINLMLLIISFYK